MSVVEKIFRKDMLLVRNERVKVHVMDDGSGVTKGMKAKKID